MIIFYSSCIQIEAQYNSAVHNLNAYKHIVLKPANKHDKYNDEIEEQITEILVKSGFGQPLSPDVLLSADVNNCDIITLEYNIKNTSYSSVDLVSDIEFINCNYEVVYELKDKMSFTFYNNKAIKKMVDATFEVFENYTYSYAPPEPIEEKEPEPAPKEELLAQKTDHESQQPKYRGGADPLKGLDVASAREDLQIGNYYALVIGINEYSGEWDRLENAVRDAKTVASTLKSNYVFHDFRCLYDHEATRVNIIKEFEWLIKNVKSNDNVLIYYSGHGEFVEAINKGFWVPVDAKSRSMSNLISNNDIQSFLKGVRSKHTLLVSDACFSGDLLRGKTLTIPYENDNKYYYKVHSLLSRKAISSGGVEPVMDGGQDGHSVFTYYFLKALRENNKKYYDASEVYERIKIPVVNNSDQVPDYKPVKNTGDEGGQFVFIKK